MTTPAADVDRPVGSRVAVLDEIATLVRHGRGLRVVTVHASGGQGRTWLLRALYERLVTHDRYWLPRLPAEALFPPAHWGPGAVPGRLWLAGQSGPALVDSLTGQVQAHLPALRVAVAKSDPARVAGALLLKAGVLAAKQVPLVGAVHDGVGLVRSGHALFRNRQAYNADVRDDEHVRSRRLAEQLLRVVRDELPVVLAIDDAHEATSSLSLLRAIAHEHRRCSGAELTVLCTVDVGHSSAWQERLQKELATLDAEQHDVVLPDVTNAEAAELLQVAAPSLSRTQAAAVAKRLATPQALLAAAKGVPDAETLMRVVLEGGGPPRDARMVYERLWRDLPPGADSALLAWHRLQHRTGMHGAVLPRALLWGLWARVRSGQAGPVPWLRVTDEDLVVPPDHGQSATVRGGYDELASQEKHRLERHVDAVLEPFAQSASAWQDLSPDAARVGLAHAVIESHEQRRLEPGEGSVVAALLCALQQPAEQAQIHLARAETWLSELHDPAEALHLEVALVRMHLEAEALAAVDDVLGVVRVLGCGLREAMAYKRFSDRHHVRARLAWAHVQAGQWKQAVREGRHAASQAHHVGTTSREFATHARLAVLAGLLGAGDQDSLAAEAQDLLQSVRSWFGPEHGSRLLVEEIVAALSSVDIADKHGMPPSRADDVDLAAQRLQRRVSQGLRADHPVILRARLDLAEALLARGDAEQARIHAVQARALLEGGGVDAERLTAVLATS